MVMSGNGWYAVMDAGSNGIEYQIPILYFIVNEEDDQVKAMVPDSSGICENVYYVAGFLSLKRV